MGRKLNTSQSVAIQTELVPLSDSFVIEPNGSTEQWYYDNTGEYAPDRSINPLTLTPKITAVDEDMNRRYTPTINIIHWYALEYVYNETSQKWEWAETEITNQVDGADVDYVRSGNNLIVKKNVSYSHAVTIRAHASYIDPRDVAITYEVEQTQELTTNRDATIVYPQLTILDDHSRTYNPLIDASSQITLNASAMMGDDDVTQIIYFIWYVKTSQTTEALLETHPAYVSGQNTSQVVIDMMYAEDITIVLHAKASQSAATLYPTAATHTLAWSIPYVDTTPLPYNGSAVFSNEAMMKFGMIVNCLGNTLSDEVKRANLRYHWYTRKGNVTAVTDLGWGEEVNVEASTLRSVRDQQGSLVSAAVFADVHLLGAYENVTCNSEQVTCNNENVIARGLNF